MISMKLVWFITVAFTFLEGCHCSNVTQNTTEPKNLPVNTTSWSGELEKETLDSSIGNTPWLEEIKNTTDTTKDVAKNTTIHNFDATSVNHTSSELFENSKATPKANEAVLTSPLGSLNVTCATQSWSDIVKTNYTTAAEAVGLPEENLQFRQANWAAIAAGIFLVSAAFGYLSCVAYRQFLLKKYGNSQILIGEEVYDTTDLRNFEI